jgi:hypothetical protein
VKNILFVSTQPQRFLDQLQLAEKISDKKIVNIKFFISEEVFYKYTDIIKKIEFNIINTMPTKLEVKKDNSTIRSILKKIISPSKIRFLRVYIDRLKTIKIFTKSFINQEKCFLDTLNYQHKAISKLILDNKIDALLINGDRHLGYEPVFLKISKKLKIPSIIIYLVDYADEERIFLNDTNVKKIKPNFLTSRYISDSQLNLNYRVARGSYYYPHTIANALNKFGVITLNPYVMGSGFSNILCLNNEYYKNLYIKNGVPEEKIRVVGDASYDNLYRNYIKQDQVKIAMIEKYGLDHKKSIVIIALPQLAEHNILTWDEHWKEANFLLENCNKLNKNILISLHPKMNRDSYLFLEGKYNCKILEERLADTLVIADVFIATFSSTVIWSVLCGITTLLVDFYGLNYTMYDFLTSIKKLDDKSLFLDTLKNIFDKDVAFKEDWKKLSKDEVFDGNTAKRYLDLINEVTKN